MPNGKLNYDRRTCWLLVGIVLFILSPTTAEALARPSGGNSRWLAQTMNRQSPRTGLLALGMPATVDRYRCVICWLTRESSADFAPLSHANGGPSRIILMRHADKPDDLDDEDLSEAGM